MKFPKSKHGIPLFVPLILALLASTTWSEESEIKNWEFELMPYISFPFGGSADVTIVPVSGEDDDSSIGLANGDLDMMFVTRAEIWRKRIGFIFDGRYINADFDLNLFADNQLLQNQGIPSPLLHSEAQAGILEFFFSYRLLDLQPFKSSEAFRLQFEPYIGARWDIFDLRLTAPSGQVFSDDVNTWAEVALGANLEFWLTRGLSLAVRGDAGGFGWGEASDITWKMTTLINYRFPKVFGVFAGYQFFEIDKKSVSLGNLIAYDLFLHGPVLGFTLFY
jgi:hypothetical protein